MYRLGWPGARILGRFGVALEVKVFVRFDKEAGVFVGVSSDLPGLVIEAESLDEMAREVHEMVPALLNAQPARVRAPVAARLSYTDALACA